MSNDKLITDLDLISSLQLTDFTLVARVGATVDYKVPVQDIVNISISALTGSLATVASSGQYSDLINKPTLGSMAAQNSNAVSITGGSITGLSNPVNPADAANKSYVDSLLSGFSERGASDAATTANLSATYNNGSSGVGATLTATSNGAIVIDSVSLSLNQVVLVKDQTSQFQNGLYTVTTVGNGSTPWVLTRSTNYDQPSEISSGTYTIIKFGSVNQGTMWVEIGSGPFTIGTTAIIFVEINVAPLTTTFIGSVTGSGSGTITLTIANNAVSNANMAQMAPHTYKGNNTGSTANPTNVTAAQLTADLTIFSTISQGVVPASGGDGAHFLRADGVWATGPVGFNSITGPNTSVVGGIPLWGNTSGSTLTDSAVLISTDNTLSANSDLIIATQKATKGYVDTSVSVIDGGTASS